MQTIEQEYQNEYKPQRKNTSDSKKRVSYREKMITFRKKLYPSYPKSRSDIYKILCIRGIRFEKMMIT